MLIPQHPPLTSLASAPPLLLGQAAQADSPAADVFKWLAVIVVVAIIVIVVAAFVRRRMLGDDEPDTPGFTLGDLRQMHATGQLTDEEYENARRGMIARSRSLIEQDDQAPDPAAPPGAPGSAPPGEHTDPPADGRAAGPDSEPPSEKP